MIYEPNDRERILGGLRSLPEMSLTGFDISDKLDCRTHRPTNSCADCCARGRREGGREAHAGQALLRLGRMRSSYLTANTVPWDAHVQKIMIAEVRKNLDRVTGQLQVVHKHMLEENKPFLAEVLDGLDGQYERLKARQWDL